MDAQAINDFKGKSLTQTNPYIISDTTLHDFSDYPVYAIQALADTVFDTGTLVYAKGNDITTITLKAGQVLYAIASKIKLSSGAVVAYRSNIE